MKKFAGFVVFALLQFGFVFDAFAFINNAFEVNGVSVSANSVSSSEARGKALVGARSIAFKKVLNRLLDTESLEKVIIPESANIEKFVQTYKIANEKTTSTSYKADFNIVMNKQLVVEYLKNQGLEPLLDKMPSTLIIPVDYRGVSLVDEEFGNALTSMLADENSDNMAKIVLPVGLDLPVNKIKEFYNANFLDIRQLLYKYNVDNLVLVKIAQNGNTFNVELTDKKSGKVLTFDAEDNYLDVADKVIVALNDLYKNYSKFLDGSARNVSIIVPVNSLNDWLNIKKKFASQSALKNMKEKALKFDKVQIEVEYNYDLNSVVSAITSLGFGVDNKGAYLVIKR